MKFQRGDIVICVISGDYGKPRPAVVVQSDLFNETHPSISICPITTHLLATPIFRLSISPNKTNGLKESSQIMVDKILTVQQIKIREKIGHLTSPQKEQLDDALKMWLDLT